MRTLYLLVNPPVDIHTGQRLDPEATPEEEVLVVTEYLTRRFNVEGPVTYRGHLPLCVSLLFILDPESRWELAYLEGLLWLRKELNPMPFDRPNRKP